MKWCLVVFILSNVASAARPGGERRERLVTAREERTSRLYWSLDGGASLWTSSLVTALSGQARVGFGTYLGRDIRLGGELDVGMTSAPPSKPALLGWLGLSLVFSWNVVALISPTAPFEVGPELAVGAAAMSNGAWAAPGLQGGLYAGYRVTPDLLVGMRVRGWFDYWFAAPAEFHGGRYVRGLEPLGMSGLVSLVRTF